MCLRLRGVGDRGGGDVPSYVAVAHEDRCHWQGLGESGRELGVIAFGQWLLVGDHCSSRCQSLVANEQQFEDICLPRSGLRWSFFDAIS